MVRLAVALQLLLACWFVTNTETGTAAAWVGLPLDDAWIHLVYGRALLQTGLPAYNPGQLEAGFSSPLYLIPAMLAVALSWAGVPIGVAAKLASLLPSLAMPWFAARLAERRGGKVAGGAAALIVALSPTVAFSQVSGMEVGLAATLLLWTWDRLDRGAGAGGPLALAILARPEAALLVPWAVWRGGPRTLAVPAVAVLAWSAACLAITGHPLPATFYAKAAAFDVRRLPVALDVLARCWPWGILALVVGWRERALLAFVATFVAAVAGGRLIGTDPDWFYFLRYFQPAEPLLAVVAAVGFARLARFRLAWLLLLPWLYLTGTGLAHRRELYAWNCQNIEEMQGELARWIAEHSPEDAAVATPDAGVIRYRGGRRTRDVMGLNDQEVLFDPRLRGQLHNDPEALARWLADRQVDWLVTFPRIFPFTDPARHPERWFEVVVVIESPHYTLLAPTQATIALLHRRAVPVSEAAVP